MFDTLLMIPILDVFVVLASSGFLCLVAHFIFAAWGFIASLRGGAPTNQVDAIVSSTCGGNVPWPIPSNMGQGAALS